MRPRNSTTSPVLLGSCWAHSHQQTLDLFPVKGSKMLHTQPYSTSSPASPALTHISARLMASKHVRALPHGSPPLPQPASPPQSRCRSLALRPCPVDPALPVSTTHCCRGTGQGSCASTSPHTDTYHGSTSRAQLPRSRTVTLPQELLPRDRCLHACNPRHPAARTSCVHKPLYRLTSVYICTSSVARRDGSSLLSSCGTEHRMKPRAQH